MSKNKKEYKNYINYNQRIDVDELIDFIKSKRGDDKFLKKVLLSSGIYNKKMKLKKAYKTKV